MYIYQAIHKPVKMAQAFIQQHVELAQPLCLEALQKFKEKRWLGSFLFLTCLWSVVVSFTLETLYDHNIN